jgi:hypothetical protein
MAMAVEARGYCDAPELEEKGSIGGEKGVAKHWWPVGKRRGCIGEPARLRERSNVGCHWYPCSTKANHIRT